MTSLYKRATPDQRWMLKVVEQAVMDAAHFHPEIEVDRRGARSIAKRAVGTLTADPRLKALGGTHPSAHA